MQGLLVRVLVLGEAIGVKTQARGKCRPLCSSNAACCRNCGCPESRPPLWGTHLPTVTPIPTVTLTGMGNPQSLPLHPPATTVLPLLPL